MSQHSEKAAAETFREIFDQSTDLMYIHDENGVYLDVNQTVIDTYGYSKEELIGETPMKISAPGLNDLDKVGELTMAAWERGEIPMFEWWSMRKDGSIFPKEVVLKRGKYFGKDVIIACAREISKRKRDEQELLRKSNQLKALNKELDSFMWKVSHDLKSPLSSIKGIINVAKIEKNQENLKSYFDHIEASIEKLNVFIKGMEDITRNKQREVNYAPIDFDVLLDSVMEDFQFSKTSEGVHVERNIDQKVKFGSDSLILRSVLNNLVSNSYKYKSDTEPKIKISVKAGESEGVIEVEDNGIGINEEYLPKVFDMFFRASEKSEGSGLGLFIVKEALDKIHGSIEVMSQEGKGTKFTLKIPNTIEDIN